ncbi:MAG: hypothetical protein OXH99_07785 [Bryobacterales bacterium]|nr:hypothetical protein [Bryobacterales bacterium]
MDTSPSGARLLARRVHALVPALVFMGAAAFFTLVGCGTILLLTGQLQAWQLAVSGITGAGGAIGVIGGFSALRPPDRW